MSFEDELIRRQNVEALMKAMQLWAYASAGVFNGTHCWACRGAIEDDNPHIDHERTRNCECSINETAAIISVEVLHTVIEPANSSPFYYSGSPKESPEQLHLQGIRLLMGSDLYPDEVLLWVQAERGDKTVLLWGECMGVVDGMYGRADAKEVLDYYAQKFGLEHNFKRDYENKTWVMREG